MGEPINKVQSIHTMDYYPALNRKEIRTCATTWMDFKDSTLHEMSLAQKDKYCPPARGAQRSQIHRDRRQVLEDGESEESVFRGHQVPVGKVEEFCTWTAVMAAQQCEWTYCHATNGALDMITLANCT